MSKAKMKTKKTAAHREADLNVTRLEAGLSWLSKVNVELHAQINEERQAAKQASVRMRATFDREVAQMCVDRAALEGSITELKRQLVGEVMRSATRADQCTSF